MAQNDGKINGDTDAGGGDRRLYPSMTENPSLRWAFIRKVYSILSFQLLGTVAVSAIVVFIRPIAHFLNDNPKGEIDGFFIMLPPCLRMVILEAAIVTCAVVVSLTLYTFWAAKHGHDYAFLFRFIYTYLSILLFFTFIQVFMPMGDLESTIFGSFLVGFFSSLLIYDTESLIKRFNYDKHVPVAVCLYLDIVNLFVVMVGYLVAWLAMEVVAMMGAMVVVRKLTLRSP